VNRCAPGRRSSRLRTAIGVACGVAVTGALLVILAGRRDEFGQALDSAPLLILLAAAALQALALVSRCEAWNRCVRAAGGTVGRRALYCAASTGNLASQMNHQLGAAARITVLRRLAPSDAPRVPALIAAEVPIVTIEAVLAALTSFTLVGPLGLPWWVPLLCVAPALALAVGLRSLAGRRDRACWAGLAVLRSLNGRSWVILLVLVAVFAQILRNWLVLEALGVNASLFDAVAVLIAMVVLSQLPVGPSVGAASVVAILGSGGVALAAAAGVLLTATGTVGALAFAGWAAADRLAHWRTSRARPGSGVPRAQAG
jgi:uncharacterized membrane protein YbhN (UPF0104 family)